MPFVIFFEKSFENYKKSTIFVISSLIIKDNYKNAVLRISRVNNTHTHDDELAKTADRVVRITDGRIML